MELIMIVLAIASAVAQNYDVVGPIVPVMRQMPHENQPLRAPALAPIAMEVNHQVPESIQGFSYPQPVQVAAAPIIGPVAQPRAPYQPKWDSLDSRPLPDWYDEAKIGIFIHWGVYSVPSFSSEWFWIDWKGKPSPNPKAKKRIESFMKNNYKPQFTYQDFAKELTAELFDPDAWAHLIEKSGAKYVILTSKHHEGYALWPSKYSFGWNSVDVGPHRDIVGELRKAILKRKTIRFGLYHSLYEWFHPLYLSDKKKNFTTRHFVDNKVYPEMEELVNQYKPDVFWSDGDWEAPSEYWKSREFLTWLYNESPVRNQVITNDRWGTETLCKHGGMFTCQDRYNPGKLQGHKWENAMTIDKKTWGFNRAANIQDYMTTQELIDQIVTTVSCGGNIVMNIGPSKDGTISPIFQDRLLDVGKWLKVNGEAIYATSPWDKCQNDTVATDVWYTVNKNTTNLYVIILRWPKNGILLLGCPELTKSSQVTLLGLPDTVLKAVNDKNLLNVTLPDKAVAPTSWASVLKISSFKIL